MVQRQELARSPDTVEHERQSPRPTKVVMSSEYEAGIRSSALQVAAEAGDGIVVYMNRDGGTYTPGQNDSRENRTTLLSETAVIPPASMSDAEWGDVLRCVQDQFARFRMVITDVDPGDVPHYESVVAGRPEDLGQALDVGGVSPFTSRCGVIPNSIVFVFSDSLPNTQVICEFTAQEIAHSFGLDHQYLCEDPMSYLTGCGPKTFQDEYSACGEFSPRPCRQEGAYDCGTETQNSVQLLSERVGLWEPNGGTSAVTISEPLDGSQVRPGFEVMAQATSAQSVELLVDGIRIQTLSSPPFRFATPRGLRPDTTHVVEVVADGAESDSISVFVADGEFRYGPTLVQGGCSVAKGTATPWSALLCLLCLSFLRIVVSRLP